MENDCRSIAMSEDQASYTNAPRALLSVTATGKAYPALREPVQHLFNAGSMTRPCDALCSAPAHRGVIVAKALALRQKSTILPSSAIS